MVEGMNLIDISEDMRRTIVEDKVEEMLGDTSGGAGSVTDTLDRIHEGLLTGRRIECVANFVGDEHVGDFLRHVVPAGHNENASLDIERSRLNRLVLDGDVLGGHEPAKFRSWQCYKH